jgi:hypothetical protein
MVDAFREGTVSDELSGSLTGTTRAGGNLHAVRTLRKETVACTLQPTRVHGPLSDQPCSKTFRWRLD